MKKLFISLLLINILSFQINAETYTGSTSISLTYDIEPTYSVKIPKTIDISSNTTHFQYYISGDIYADQTLQVLFDKQTTIYNANSSYKVSISQSKTIFYANELTTAYKSYDASISHESLTPGKWFGTLNVVISLIGGA